MKPINYIKPPNCTKLFKKLNDAQFTNCQNYNPLYELFFTLSPQNFNSIHLNHKYHIIDILNTDTATNQHSIFHSVLQDCSGNSVQPKNKNMKDKKKAYSFNQNIFVKIAPLLDPFYYVCGKYPPSDLDKLIQFLPHPPCVSQNTLEFSDKHVEQKILNIHNSSYVDGFFSFLSNQLVESFQFINGIRYYGSFLCIKEDFKFNIADDLEYLVNSEYFNAHKNTLFSVEDYSHLIEPVPSRPRLNFDNLQQLDANSCLIFEDVSPDTNVSIIDEKTEPISTDIDIQDVYSQPSQKSASLYSDSCSTISSRSSMSDDEDNVDDEDEDEDDASSGSGSYDSEGEDEQIYATISKFPVQLICLEECIETLGDYTCDNKISDNEWFSILMQVIMTLLVYQKTYHFTHNDLHTNNIMYVNTNKKFIYYRYNQKLYRVPTFGKIYKIIDFGRAIFNYRGHRFCSDAFKKDGDAHSQYNTEPFYDPKKTRIDPNYSFDLCRLACTVFDDLVDVDNECTISELVSKLTNPVAKIISEWCESDDGKNVLYKDNGDERYPDFKLYKMISRKVHKHTPDAQLSRPEFKKYECAKNHSVPKDVPFINIDAMECYA